MDKPKKYLQTFYFSLSLILVFFGLRSTETLASFTLFAAIRAIRIARRRNQRERISAVQGHLFLNKSQGVRLAIARFKVSTSHGGLVICHTHRQQCVTNVSNE